MNRSRLMIAFLVVYGAAQALPLGGVNLTVRPLAVRESRSTPWKTDYGSYEKFATKSVAVEIEVRRTVRGDPGVSVEWYFLAKDAKTREPFVFDAARAEMRLPEGVTQKFSVTSGAVSDSDRKYVALGQRYKDGEKLWGWVVIVRSGSSIIASEGSLFEVREWLLKAVRSGSVDRAPIAVRKKNA